MLSSTEGKIGIKDSNSIYIGNFEGNNVGLRFIGDTYDIRPCTSDGSNQDNTVDLGDANARFKDLIPVRRCLPWRHELLLIS